MDRLKNAVPPRAAFFNRIADLDKLKRLAAELKVS